MESCVWGMNPNNSQRFVVGVAIEVGMLPDVIVHTSDMSTFKGGGERDKKVSIKGALVNRPRPMTDREGMDMLSMVVLIVRRTCSRVTDPLGS